MTILQGFKLWGRHLRVKTWQKRLLLPCLFQRWYFDSDGVIHVSCTTAGDIAYFFLLNDSGVRCLKFFVSFSELLEKEYFSKVVTKVLICGTSALLEGLRKPNG